MSDPNESESDQRQNAPEYAGQSPPATPQQGHQAAAEHEGTPLPPSPPPMPPGPFYGVSGQTIPINNNLGWAIGGLFVCWPFGIPSLIKALEVQRLWTLGQTEQAEHSAAQAKKWGQIGVYVGAALLVLYSLGLGVFAFSVS